MLLVRSSVQPARPAASGSIDSRAVIPPGSKNDPAAARPASTTVVSASMPWVATSIGIAATEAADMASESIETRRRPRKSTAVPATRVATSSGSVAAAATSEASVALPVRCSTSQGKATIEMPLAAAARNADDRISRTGPREVLTAGSIDT